MTIQFDPRATSCPDCGHWKSRHLKSYGCLICVMFQAEGHRIPSCKNHFLSPLSAAEMEQARKAAKSSYDGQDICAICGEWWWAHEGFLCPNGQTLFVLYIHTGRTQ